MTQNETPARMRPSRLFASEAGRRRVAKTYVLVHAVVAGCSAVIGLEYLIGWRWIPAIVYVPVKAVASVGLLPFILSSPIAFSIMLFILARRDREWLYLGVCDVSVFVLQIIAIIAAVV